MGDEGRIEIRLEGDLVSVRKAVRDEAGSIGFGITDVTRIVTAASELARNIIAYAGSGIMEWRRLDDPEGPGLELTFVDRGPGISDVGRAMERGYSTSGGLGLGLPGTQRLMDEMEIESSASIGTKVTVRKWLRGRTVHRSTVNAPSRSPIPAM